MFRKIILNKIFLIFVLALVVRLGFLIFFPPVPVEDSDAAYYNEVALNIVSGKGITYRQETYSIAPAYPVFLAGIYKIFGQNYDAVRTVQAILSALTCVLIYLIAKNLFNKKVALIAGSIAVIYPSFILQSTAIMTETLFIFLLVLAMLCLVLCLEKSSAKWGLVAGISFGLATLTRPVALFFPVLILPLVFLYKKKQPTITAGRNFLFVVIAMFLIMSPWIFRDYLGLETVKLSQKLSNEVVASRDVGRVARSVKKTFDKDSFFQILSNFYKLYRYPYTFSDVTGPGVLLFHYLILVTALLGLILGYKKWRRFLPLVLIIIYITFPHIIPGEVFRVETRYVFPIMPFIMILSAFGINIIIKLYYPWIKKFLLSI